MKLAGTEAAKFCTRPKAGPWAYLVFGEDDGVVSDNALALRSALSASPDAEHITLDEDEVKREPALLFDALEARSLLGHERVLRLRTSGEKASALVLEAVALGEADPGRFAAPLIITAGALARNSKLRSGIEAARHAIALHVFSDEIADLAGLVRARLQADGVTVGDAALAAFVAHLPGHRGLANQEVEKLCLYGKGLGREIGAADLRALSTTDTDQALAELAGLAFRGNGAGATAALAATLNAGTSPISVLRALQREAERLLRAHALSAGGGDIGAKLRPPVFRTDWPAFRNLMALWPPKRLVRTLERIYDAEAQTKQAGPLGEALLRQLVADLCLAAERAAGRH